MRVLAKLILDNGKKMDKLGNKFNVMTTDHKELKKEFEGQKVELKEMQQYLRNLSL